MFWARNREKEIDNINETKNLFGRLWYMCLKIENCCLKIFVEMHMGKKVYGNA